MAKFSREDLKKLKDMKKMLDPLTKGEFLEHFEEMLKAIKSHKDTSKSEFKEMNKLYQELLKAGKEEMKNINNEDVTRIKGDVDAMKMAIQTKLEAVRDGLDGRDGKDADEDSIVEKVIANFKIPTIEEIKDDLPIMGEEVRDSLELLQGDARLEMSAIKGLEEKLEELLKLAKIGTTVRGVGPVNQVQYADLTDQCDGATKEFEIPRARHIIQLTGTQYPIILRPEVDYTVSNKILTLTDEVSAPSEGQTLTLLYIK